MKNNTQDIRKKLKKNLRKEKGFLKTTPIGRLLLKWGNEALHSTKIKNI